MDAGTSRFYDAYAPRLAATESRRSAMLAHLLAALPAGAWVLDVGAGSGRDMAALHELGFEPFGVEPNAAMRETALRAHPALAGRLADATLPDLGRPFAEQRPQGFDAVLCSAVLMHLPPDELPGALASLVRQLRPAAPDDAASHRPALLLSLPEMDATQLADGRDADGRRFHNHAPADVATLLDGMALTLALADVNDAVRASTGTRWHTLVFRRQAAEAATGKSVARHL